MQQALKQTVQNKTQQLEKFFETKDIVYQAKIGFFVTTDLKNVSISQLNEVLAKIGLKFANMRLTETNQLRFFLSVNGISG